eukprot:1153299-Pelagomonas_calceolata.AAC.3
MVVVKDVPQRIGAGLGSFFSLARLQRSGWTHPVQPHRPRAGQGAPQIPLQNHRLPGFERFGLVDHPTSSGAQMSAYAWNSIIPLLGKKI